MRSLVVSLLSTLRVLLRDRAALQLEILALRLKPHAIDVRVEINPVHGS